MLIISTISLLFIIVIPFYNSENITCCIFNVEYKYDNTINIGDYIQSIAAKQFCNGKKIVYIERDSVSIYKGKLVKAIMNAWWRINKNNMIPSKYVDPLYVSYHLDNPQQIKLDYIRYLKRHEPIGCRDTFTKEIFSRLGIKSYFSGCLTLTLGKSYKNKHLQRSKIIYIVDCPLYYKYKHMLMNLISNVTHHSNFTILKINHSYNKSLTHKERFELADKILKKYESAYLVLTSRLHACLPCIAMNTPVILIRNNLDNRFSGLINFTNYILISKMLTSINVLHTNGYIINPNTSTEYIYKLEKRVQKFLHSNLYSISL